MEAVAETKLKNFGPVSVGGGGQLPSRPIFKGRDLQQAILERKEPELRPLYKVSLIEKDGQHFYSIDDIPTLFRGVTGILDIISKPALVPWSSKNTAEYIIKILKKVSGRSLSERFLETLYLRSKKQPRFVKESAARIGSAAHKTFDAILRLEKEPGTTPFLDSFMYWLSKERLKIVAGDTKVASIFYGYGGSLDALAVDENGDYVIIDFKTGNSIYDTHALQIAAYAQAFTETYSLGYLPEGVVVRYVKEKKKFERCEIRSIHDSFQAFSTAFDLLKLMERTQYKTKEIIKEKKEKKKNAAT